MPEVPFSHPANWSFPTAVRFGPGRIAELGPMLAELGLSRPLVVTDEGLKLLPPVDATLSTLICAGLGPGFFTEVKPNPTGTNVETGVAKLRAGGYDSVVAVGGGSALDAAKAIALMATQERPIWDFEDIGDNWQRVDTSRLIPVIAIPTTAGTGSELGRSSVITDESGHRKVIIFHPRMMPVAVIMDPELTIGLPAHITAATGMDALSHSLEAFSAPSFHPMAEGVALNALRIIRQWLPVAGRGWLECRGALADACRLRHGLRRPAEGTWGGACARPSPRCPLRCPPRPAERGSDALCGGIQCAGDWRQAGLAHPFPRTAR